MSARQATHFNLRKKLEGISRVGVNDDSMNEA